MTASRGLRDALRTFKLPAPVGAYGDAPDRVRAPVIGHLGRALATYSRAHRPRGLRATMRSHGPATLIDRNLFLDFLAARIRTAIISHEPPNALTAGALACFDPRPYRRIRVVQSVAGALQKILRHRSARLRFALRLHDPGETPRSPENLRNACIDEIDRAIRLAAGRRNLRGLGLTLWQFQPRRERADRRRGLISFIAGRDDSRNASGLKAYALTASRRQIVKPVGGVTQLAKFGHLNPDDDLGFTLDDWGEPWARELLNGIARLDNPSRRTALELHYVRGFTPIEVAALMNESAGNMRVILHRGRKDLLPLHRLQKHDAVTLTLRHCLLGESAVHLAERFFELHPTSGTVEAVSTAIAGALEVLRGALDSVLGGRRKADSLGAWFSFLLQNDDAVESVREGELVGEAQQQLFDQITQERMTRGLEQERRLRAPEQIASDFQHRRPDAALVQMTVLVLGWTEARVNETYPGHEKVIARWLTEARRFPSPTLAALARIMGATFDEIDSRFRVSPNWARTNLAIAARFLPKFAPDLRGDSPPGSDQDISNRLQRLSEALAAKKIQRPAIGIAKSEEVANDSP